MNAHKKRTTCRVCGGSKLTPFWTAGDVYVVGFPQKPDRNLLKAPLTLCVCEECRLVQLQDTVSSDLLDREFWYRSATNEMMRKELRDIATVAYQHAIAAKRKRRELWALDIGCNDGQLLMSYPGAAHDGSFNCIGMDPAKNIQASGEQTGGWWFIDDYFSKEKALWASDGEKYDIVTAISMFYDLENPVRFLNEVKDVLAPEGVFMVQMNYLPTMLSGHCVDNVCHEHLTYFSLSTLLQTFGRVDLDIYYASLNPTNGGSLRVFACHKGKRQIDRAVRRILQDEEALCLDTILPYGQFNYDIQRVCRKLNDWIYNIYQSGKTIYAYGASTRGTTLLQLLNTSGKIVAAAERDQNKLGRYMVGSWIPIISEEEARAKADYFLVLPWHFFSAIKAREEKWVLQGGKFIIPLPEPTIYGRLLGRHVNEVIDMTES